MSKIAELTQKRNKIITDASALVQRGLNTPEAKESYRKMLADADDIESDLEMLNRLERAMPGHQSQSVASVAPIAKAPENRRGKLNAAWRAYLSNKFDESVPEHRDLLTSTSGSDGGAVVSQDFAGFVSQAQKWYAPLADYVRVRTTKAMQPSKVSRSDDRTAGMRLVTEGSGTSVFEADATFSSTVVFHDLLSTGLTRFSNELLADSGFDLERFLSDQASIRYGRGLETILTRGVDSNGVATPNNPGLINFAPVAVTTATLAAGIGWKDLVNLYDATDVSYLPRSYWQMSSKTRNYLLSLEDSTSRPYFVPAPSEGAFDMLLGKPILINQSLDLPTLASGIPILFGSLYDGLEMVRSELTVRPLHERYAEFNESAIVVSTTVGSTALAPGAIQALKLAAS